MDITQGRANIHFQRRLTMRMTKTAPAGIISNAMPQDEPAGTALLRWTPEIIAGLDWQRLLQLARALASTGGFHLTASNIDIAGGADFVMSAGMALDRKKILVRLAQWNRWMASEECLECFTSHVRVQNFHNGVFIAPGGFSPEARVLGKKAGVELVDAVMLSERLNLLTAAHKAAFQNIGIAGDSTTPTCPICMKRLQKGENEPLPALDYLELPDVFYKSDDIVAAPVLARGFEVRCHCDVRFLNEVRAQHMEINGTAEGDFLCEGTLVLNAGAVLRGTVAARSVLVRPGAQMEAETRIMEGSLKLCIATDSDWVWQCRNPEGKEPCKVIRFAPHD
jgi:hypothetical protein